MNKDRMALLLKALPYFILGERPCDVPLDIAIVNQMHTLVELLPLIMEAYTTGWHNGMKAGFDHGVESEKGRAEKHINHMAASYAHAIENLSKATPQEADDASWMEGICRKQDKRRLQEEKRCGGKTRVLLVDMSADDEL